METRRASLIRPLSAGQSGLCSQYSFMSSSLQRKTDDAFRLGIGIDIGGIQELYPCIERGVDDSNGALLVSSFPKGIRTQS
ncbi:hypothetical protein D3C78_1850690 [compost metagenome]